VRNKAVAIRQMSVVYSKTSLNFNDVSICYL